MGTFPDLPIEISAAIIVSSDRASSGTYEDLSGPVAYQWLSERGYKTAKALVIPDAAHILLETLTATKADLVVISGGTGLGPRDITPQTLDAHCDYPIPGFGELLRRESAQFSLNAYLSRCGGWVWEERLILALPGNPKAVREQLDIIADTLPHAILAIKGKCQNRRRLEP